MSRLSIVRICVVLSLLTPTCFVDCAIGQLPFVVFEDGAALYQDSFPVSGSIDASTLASRDALDCPLDAAIDTLDGPGIASRDYLEFTAFTWGGQAYIDSVTIFYSLNMNPLFEAPIRTLPTGAVVSLGSGINGWGQCEGSIGFKAPPMSASYGCRVHLPDVDFMYPGDILEYYIEIKDTFPSTGTWPMDITGYDDTTMDYDSNFVVRALPTILDASGTQPEILFVNARGHGEHEAQYRLAMNQNSYFLGKHYDMYTVNSPASGEPNGIGSAGSHGATHDQLAGYHRIIYTAGAGTAFLLNDGSGVPPHTESDDIALLKSWQSLPEKRRMTFFGENLASVLWAAGGAGANFVHRELGVDVISSDVRPHFPGAWNAIVDWVAIPLYPPHPPFLVGTLPFDEITNSLTARGGTATVQCFQGYPNLTSGVAIGWYSSYGDLQVNFTFVFSLDSLGHVLLKGDTRTSLAVFLESLLSSMGAESSAEAPVSSPRVAGRMISELSVAPNPFNPATEISFEMAEPGNVTMRIFTLRGELVREFAPRLCAAGHNVIRWQGDDGSGSGVASGVYVAELAGGGETLKTKLVLMK